MGSTSNIPNATAPYESALVATKHNTIATSMVRTAVSSRGGTLAEKATDSKAGATNVRCRNASCARSPDHPKRDIVLAAVKASSRCRGLLLRASHRTGRAGLAYGSLDRYVRMAAAAALTPARGC